MKVDIEKNDIVTWVREASNKEILWLLEVISEECKSRITIIEEDYRTYWKLESK